MMWRRWFILGPTFAATACFGWPGGDRPALAVLVVVDQLTPALLERYDPAFEGGLRRLLDEGLVYTNAVHDHAGTVTAAGHATLATGVHPALSGIVGNSWREYRNGDWESVYSVQDPDVAVVGGLGPGRSPRNLLRGGLADWLREQDSTAHVVTVSGKDRSAVLLAGQVAGDVYWFDDRAGVFATSTYYRDALPDWVEAYNRQSLRPLLEKGCWESRVPPELAGLSRRDTVEYEADGVHTRFPHCAGDGVYRNPANWLMRSPFMDQASLGLARAAVVELALGDRSRTDYLGISLDATDHIGHRFGPYSREQFDNLLRLDRALGEFLAFLDETVGRRRFVFVLTADHGVMPMPEYLEEEGRPGRRLISELNVALRESSAEVDARFGPAGVEEEENGAGSADHAERRIQLAERLESYEFIEQAFALEVLETDMPADSFTELYRRSFHPDRQPSLLARFGVAVRLREGFLVGRRQTGHGTAYLHDRHVPLVFYGGRVRPGRIDRRVHTVDVAPTLASLIGLRIPPDLDGRPLLDTGWRWRIGAAPSTPRSARTP